MLPAENETGTPTNAQIVADDEVYEAIINQVRKEELLPQHWQVISHRKTLDEEEFAKFPAVQRLRSSSKDEATAERRIGALKAAWHELGGKQPALWTVPDLFAAMRRLIERQIDVDFYDLLSAVRDVWRGIPLPSGREQLEILWASLAFIRQKTKK